MKNIQDKLIEILQTYRNAPFSSEKGKILNPMFYVAQVENIVKEALQQQKKEIFREIERIHTKHYMKWIPTEEQKGYRKAQVDIMKRLTTNKYETTILLCHSR